VHAAVPLGVRDLVAMTQDRDPERRGDAAMVWVAVAEDNALRAAELVPASKTVTPSRSSSR
jgi:hypothetical protein